LHDQEDRPVTRVVALASLYLLAMTVIAFAYGM
jgi:hypothetical protein